MLYNESKSHCPPCPPCPPHPPKKQTHVHEIQGSVEIAEIKKPHYPDGKKDPYYDEDKKDPYYDKKDPYYDCDKEKKDPYYDCDKEKKDPYYDCDKRKKDPYYDNDEDKKDPYYDCDKSRKKPCYDYDEDKKDPYDERKRDHHKRCPKEEGHNHRFALVSGEAIPVGCKDHYHEVKFRTDFYEDHFHVFVGKTGGAIRVGDRHVHFLESQTSCNDGHRHDFRVATLIEDPIGD